MSPETSTYGKYDLTYAGIYQIWTGYFDPPPTTISSSGGGLSVSPNPSIHSAHHHHHQDVSQLSHPLPIQEPVKQTSAAWTALRSQSSHPSNRPSPPPPAPTPPSHLPIRGGGRRIGGNFEISNDPEFDNAIHRINAARNTSGNDQDGSQGGGGGFVGNPRLLKAEKTERAGQRRMILAICGEHGRNWKDEVEA